MKCFYVLAVMVLFSFTACSTDDDGEVQCRETPVQNRFVFIELVNADGINLLENNTYIADDITIDYGESTIVNVVNNDVPGFENLIALMIFGEDGDTIFRIKLSETVEDILKLNLTLTTSEGECPSLITTLNAITYNDVLQVPEDFFEDLKITVVKE